MPQQFEFLGFYEAKKREELRARRMEMSRREQYEEDTAGWLGGVARVLGVGFNVPANLVYNSYARSLGVPTKSIWSHTTDTSDIVELKNPDIADNPTWRRIRLPLNILTSIGLDVGTYAGWGLTRIGVAAKALKGLGFVGKLDDAGKVVYEITEASLKQLPDWVGPLYAAGKKAGKVPVFDDIIRGMGDDVPKHLRKLFQDVKAVEATGFRGILTDVPATAAERIRKGYSGIQAVTPLGGPGRTIFPATQAAFVDKVSEIAQRVGSIDSPIIKGIKHTFRGSVPDELRRAIPGELGEDVAGLYQDAIRVDQGLHAEEIAKFAAKDTDVISANVARVRASEFRQKGFTSLGAYMDDINPKIVDRTTGLLRDESVGLNIIYKYPERIDEFRRTKQFTYRGYNLQPGTDKLAEGFDKTVRFTDDFFEKFDDSIRHVQDMGGKKGSLSSARARGADVTGIQRQNQQHYAKQLVLMADNPAGRQKVMRSMNEMGRIGKIVAGEKRTWRGATQDTIEVLRAKAQMIAKGDYTEAEKVVAQLIHDEKLLGNHTIRDILKFADKTELPKNIRIKTESMELVEAAKDVQRTIKKFTRQEVRDDLLNEIMKVNVGDLYAKVEPETITDLYVKSLPVINAFDKQQVASVIQWDKLLKRVFVDGMDEGVSTIGSVAEKAEIGKEGFKLLDDLPYARMHPQRAQEFLSARGLPFNPNDTYYWALRNDVHEALQKSAAFTMLGADSELKKGIFGMLGKVYDNSQRIWKETTLFTILGYYIRNLEDDIMRVSLEGVVLRHHTDGIGILARESDFEYFGKLFGKVGKPKKHRGFGGRWYSEKEVMKMFVDNDIMTGIGEYGAISKGGMNSIVPALKRQGVLSGSGKDTLELAEKATGWYKKMGRGYRDLMDRAIRFQAHLEAETSMALWLKNLEQYPVADAAKRTKLVKIDYQDLNAFERQVMKKIFPFYSFKKGISKYILWKYSQNPAMFRAFTKAPGAIEDMVLDPEEKYNKRLLPEWLKVASLQIGVSDEGQPLIMNLKGLTSLAELVDIIHPFKASLGMLSPFIKIPLERIAGKDFYFQRPLELYPGETTNVGGIAIKRRNPLAAIAKSLRLPKTVVDVTEAFLRETPYSVYGTSKKPSWAGHIDPSRHPKPFSQVAAQKIMGWPVTKIDVARAKEQVIFGIMDRQNEYSKAMRAIARRYAQHDPEKYRREQKRRTDEYLRIIYKYSSPGALSTFRSD